jgi:hypothetical protein
MSPHKRRQAEDAWTEFDMRRNAFEVLHFNLGGFLKAVTDSASYE